MASLSLTDLVRNRTVSPEMAAVLATAAEERRSMLGVAIPRGAGKSTVMQAALSYAPAGTAFHQLTEAQGPGLGIPATPDGGYLVMSEISTAPMLDYLWGAPVRKVFRALSRGGFSLATALHAAGMEEAFQVITGDNAVPDEHASHMDLMYYLRSIGDDWRNPLRRVMAELYEIDGVEGGRPIARLLQRWNEAEDRFEAVEQPRRIGSGNDRLVHNANLFRARSM
jgi:hypothetical protein